MFNKFSIVCSFTFILLLKNIFVIVKLIDFISNSDKVFEYYNNGFFNIFFNLCEEFIVFFRCNLNDLIDSFITKPI